MNHSPSTQRGAAFLTLIAILTAVSILFVLGQSSWQSRQRLNELPDIRAARVAHAAEALRQWYERNAADIDRSGYVVPSGGALLAAAGVPAQWDLTAVMSSQLSRGEIRYRAIAIWAPSDDDDQVPMFDTDTGELTLCPDDKAYCGQRAAAKVEGYDIQAELYGATVRKLRELAAAAQAYFHGMWLADPDHNVSVNYFRCGAPRGDLPCLDTPTELATTSLLSAIGLSGSYAFDAWGGPIVATNGGSNDDQPPYRLEFIATTPWGSSIRMYALQRL